MDFSLPRKISTNLLLAFGTVATFTIIAVGIGLWNNANTSAVQKEISTIHLANLDTSLKLTVTGSSFLSAVSHLERAITLDEAKAGLEQATKLNQDLHMLIGMVAKSQTGESGIADNLSQQALAFPALVSDLEKLVTEQLNRKSSINQAFTVAGSLRQDLNTILEKQLETADEFDIESLLRILMSANVINVTYAEAIASDSLSQISKIEYTFTNAASELRSNAAIMGPALSNEIKEKISSLSAIGLGEKSIFALRKTELVKLAMIEDKVYELQDITALLDENVSLFADQTQQAAILAGERASKAAATGQVFLILMAIASIVASASIVWFYVVRNVARRLTEMSNTMQQLADGDLSVPEITITQDEIGDMAKSLSVFKSNMIKTKKLTEEQQLTAEERIKRGENLSKMVEVFDVNITGLLQSIDVSMDELNSSSISMSDVAESAAGRASSVASASDMSAQNVQAVSAAAEELSVTVDSISTQVKRSAEVAANAVKEATKTTTQMNELQEVAGGISKVTALINDIAEQTNLLALNATIEAARAGDAGAGFAVVASEVKSLASQTAKATEQISTQIDQMQSSTSSAAQSLSGIQNIIQELAENSDSISNALNEQRQATQEIASSVVQASEGTAEVNHNISGLSESATEVGNVSSEVKNAVDNLAEQKQQLRSQVDKFLADVQAA
ncbi:MAG: HAMP domain-containing protein [Robiginitomaculum sp.]|nr:HAMP domain-containing protein [Robiginitomaculum sp.]